MPVPVPWDVWNSGVDRDHPSGMSKFIQPCSASKRLRLGTQTWMVPACRSMSYVKGSSLLRMGSNGSSLALGLQYLLRRYDWTRHPPQSHLLRRYDWSPRVEWNATSSIWFSPAVLFVDTHHSLSLVIMPKTSIVAQWNGWSPIGSSISLSRFRFSLRVHQIYTLENSRFSSFLIHVVTSREDREGPQNSANWAIPKPSSNIPDLSRLGLRSLKGHLSRTRRLYASTVRSDGSVARHPSPAWSLPRHVDHLGKKPVLMDIKGKLVHYKCFPTISYWHPAR